MLVKLGELESNSMSTSQFMDKRIMDQSSSRNENNESKDLLDLNIRPQEDYHHDFGDGFDKKDKILPNYDFQPICPISSDVGGARVWASTELDPNFGTRNYGSLEYVAVLDEAMISEIDRTMKKHADNLMHALEGVSARLAQLETRFRNLESSVDDLRTSVGNNHGTTDGKLRQIENMIREVQAGVRVVNENQEILETQLQLSKAKILDPEKQQVESASEAATSAPLQSHQQLPPTTLALSLPATLPNAPPPPNPHPNQFPRSIMPMPISHHDSYSLGPVQTAEAPLQQYHLPPPRQLQPPKASPPSPSPRPQYQPPTHIQYSQPPSISLQQPNPSQSQPPLNHHSEELAYLPPQDYSLGTHQPSGTPPPQYHGNPSQMYEAPPFSRTGPGFPSQYRPSPGLSEPYNYAGSQFGPFGNGSSVKSQQPSSPNTGLGDRSGYPQLPISRILPQALPTAAAGHGGSGASSSGSGNRVPSDDVVDKVTNMGFSRDQVRAAVRKVAESGQAVDLNVVLDKLMTDGVEQDPRPWFGR